MKKTPLTHFQEKSRLRYYKNTAASETSDRKVFATIRVKVGHKDSVRIAPRSVDTGQPGDICKQWRFAPGDASKQPESKSRPLWIPEIFADRPTADRTQIKIFIAIKIHHRSATTKAFENKIVSRIRAGLLETINARRCRNIFKPIACLNFMANLDRRHRNRENSVNG